MILHMNRLVVHPDYTGLGLGIKFINATSKIVNDRGYIVMSKFSSVPVYRAMIKSQEWRLLYVERDIKLERLTGNIKRKTGYRRQVKTFSFAYVG